MIKKEKLKKEETYFIVLLKKKDLLFASWKIDSPKWKKRIETAEQDSAGSTQKEFLFIEVLSVENDKYKKIDSIPVHGLENSWHIFVKKEYYGKRVIFSLSYRDKKEKYFDILISQEIHIPYTIENIEAIQLDEEKILFEFSEIKLAGIPGKESTSW